MVLKLKEEKVVWGRKQRVDRCEVKANIHYPTDSSLLGDGIRVLTRAKSGVKGVGLVRGIPFVKHMRKAWSMI